MFERGREEWLRKRLRGRDSVRKSQRRVPASTQERAKTRKQKKLLQQLTAAYWNGRVSMSFVNETP
jgi:hypothetical protein